MNLPTQYSYQGWTFDDFGIGFLFEEILHDSISEALGVATFDINIADGIDFSGYALPNPSGTGGDIRDDIGFKADRQHAIINIDIEGVIDYYTP